MKRTSRSEPARNSNPSVYPPGYGRKRGHDAIFKTLIENTPAAIVIYQGPKIKYVNRGLEMLTGYSAEELLKMKFWDYAHPDFQNIVRQRGLERQRGESVPSLYEYKILTKSGEERWIQTQPLYFEYEGKPAAFATVFNITERKSAEKELRESENKFRTLANNTAASIFIYLEAKFVYVNPGIELLSGYSADELLSMNFWDFVHPEFKQAIKDKEQVFQKPKSESRRYEIKILRKDGDARWIDIQLAYIEYNGVHATIGTAFDITERKEAEQRLSEIIDFLPDATFAVNTAGKVTLWNRAMEDLTGVHADEILGKGNYEYAIPFYGERRRLLIDVALRSPDKMPKTFAAQMKKHKKLSGEAYMPKMVGGTTYLYATAAPLFDAQGEIKEAIEITRDITIRKKMEEALERARVDLEKRVEERTADLTAANQSLSLEIAERKKITTDLRKKERELREKSDNLERVNMAMTVLLKRREEDKVELEEKVLQNVKELVLPYLEKLKLLKLSGSHMDYLNIMESHITDIVSPFLHNLKSKYINLTSREIEIANLVKEGKTTKTIATMLGCSTQAVDFHRFNIRKKLGMRHKKANLRARLISLK